MTRQKSYAWIALKILGYWKRLIILYKDIVKRSKWGIYVSSYDLAKATGRKHQNLMTTVKRYYKGYLHYYYVDHQYYKNQKIYYLTIRIIHSINKKGVYDELLKLMEQEKEKVSKAIHEGLKRLFG